MRHRFPCARNSAQATGRSSWTRGSAAVNRSGRVQTVQQVCWRFCFLKELVLSVVKESSYRYCAGACLTNKTGMNRGCCDMALNGIVSNHLSAGKGRNAFAPWREGCLPAGETARAVVLRESRCLPAWSRVTHDSCLSC